jgi:hypothetical protein
MVLRNLTKTGTSAGDVSPNELLARRLSKAIDLALDALPELQDALEFRVDPRVLDDPEMLDTLAEGIAGDIASQSDDPNFEIEIGEPKTETTKAGTTYDYVAIQVRLG